MNRRTLIENIKKLGDHIDELSDGILNVVSCITIYTTDSELQAIHNKLHTVAAALSQSEKDVVKTEVGWFVHNTRYRPVAGGVPVVVKWDDGETSCGLAEYFDDYWHTDRIKAYKLDWDVIEGKDKQGVNKGDKYDG